MRENGAGGGALETKSPAKGCLAGLGGGLMDVGSHSAGGQDPGISAPPTTKVYQIAFHGFPDSEVVNLVTGNLGGGERTLAA